MSLLKTISSPRDLSQLPTEKLPVVAAELRSAVQEHFALCDARMGSAVGLADLIVALDYVYDFAHDSLLFDMAHQGAAHMILAGHDRRCEDRKCVPWPGAESGDWDELLATHAGTSISKALGLAAGRTDGGKTVAVIGDGAIASGIALEALNRGEALNQDVLVILNDNEMSISRVVGAMSEYLSKIRVGKPYNELKRDAHKLLQKVPLIGSRLDRAAEQLKDAVAKALVPGHLFESLGPRYFGPVDGHNLAHLVQLLTEIRRQDGFRLLHVVTERAESSVEEDGALMSEVSEAIPGIPEGEDRPVSYALEYESQGELSWSDAACSALEELAGRDPEVVVVISSLPENAGLRRMKETLCSSLPGRVWDMGINEQHGVAFVAGLARAGRKPVFVAPATVLARAYDQIVRDVARPGLPVVFVASMAGIVGFDSGVEHSTGDIAWALGAPNLNVGSPRDAGELQRMLDLAIQGGQPFVLRTPESFVAHEDHEIPVHAELIPGKSEIIRRGTDVALLALGPLVYSVLEAAEKLAEKGLEATVVNVRYVRPLDTALLGEILSDHTLTFAIEEHGCNGMAAAMMEEAGRERMDVGRIIGVGLQGADLGRSSRSRLLQSCGLDSGSLADRILLDYRRHVRSR